MIVLVGVPGAGKTTVGRLLATRLDTTFVDVDEVIETRAGKPIGEIFTDDGESAFRDLEEATISELLAGDEAVISLGGGALGRQSTRTLVSSHTVVWLQASLAAAVDRVGLNRNRPLLLGNVRGQLAELMAQREPIYRDAANYVIDTSSLTPDQVVTHIVAELAS